MPFRRILAALALTTSTLISTQALAAPPRKAPAPTAAHTVAALPGARLLVGRATAPVKLVEYVSYTCPHCAAFEKEATDTLLLTMVGPGKGSIEYRPFLRNIVDMAAMLMVNCGTPARFLGNQQVLLRTQEKWFVLPSEAQRQRWSTGDFGSRMRAVASDMNLYPVFEGRGYARPELDRCLSNEALAKQVADENGKAVDEGGVQGTPSFLLNDKLQEAHDWASLRPALLALTR